MSRQNSDTGRINRRRFLAATGATATLGFVGTQNVAADDRVQRTYGYEFTEDPYVDPSKRQEGQLPNVREITYTIPRSKWARVESASAASRKLSRQLERRLDDTERISVGVTSQTDKPKSAKRIIVDYNVTISEDATGQERVVGEPNVPFERVEEETPYKVTGVIKDDKGREERELEVEIRRVQERQSHSCNTSDDHYDYFWWDVPGGARLDGVCTTCMPGWNSDYGYVITSAGHCFDEGESIYQGGDPYGECVESNVGPWPIDIATIEETNSRGYDYALADSDGTTDENISGWMDWQAIKDMEDDTWDPMARQGQQSGRCSGTVREYYEDDAIRHFDTEAPETDGDSGGPHFSHNSSGDALVSGMHRARHTETGHSRAGYINDLYTAAGLSY